MSDQSCLEHDIKQAFPDEYTADDWTDLVEKYVGMLAEQEVNDVQEADRRMDEYLRSFAPSEPPAVHVPNYKLIRAAAWLEASRWQSFPLLAYEIALLRHQLAYYAGVQDRINEHEIRLNEIQAAINSNSDALFRAIRPN